MSKFLDSVGLTVLWGRVKELVGNAIKTSVSDRLGAYGGIATLGADGRLADGQLPVLKTVNGQSVVGSGNIEIDLSVFKVVESLPEQGDERKVYLVKAPEKARANKNVYVEYAWVNGEWEQIGEYKAGIDLELYVTHSYLRENYLKIPASGLRYDTGHVWIGEHHNPEDPLEVVEVDISSATTERAGLMSAGDKELLNTLADNCFIGISNFEFDVNADTVKLKLPYSERISGDDYYMTSSADIPKASETAAGVMTATMFSKLNGVAKGSTADSALSEAEINAILV